MTIDIARRIKDFFPTFSKGQKKIATAVLNEYDKVAYMTAAKLGRSVGVSESTVVRFANELGFDGYAEFQRAVQELVRTRLTPNQRIEMTKARIGHGDLLENVMEADIAKIRYTLDTMDRNAFHAAVDAIVRARSIYIMGARCSEALAYFLKYNLSLIFDNVHFVNPTSTGEVFEQIFSINEKDVFIAFSFPRYSTKMVSAVKFAKKNNASIVVITDSEISPLAPFATCLLTAQSDMASFTDSLVAPFSILNAMIVEITGRKEREITERLERLEAVWDEYNVYAKQ